MAASSLSAQTNRLVATVEAIGSRCHAAAAPGVSAALAVVLIANATPVDPACAQHLPQKHSSSLGPNLGVLSIPQNPLRERAYRLRRVTPVHFLLCACRWHQRRIDTVAMASNDDAEKWAKSPAVAAWLGQVLADHAADRPAPQPNCGVCDAVVFELVDAVARVGTFPVDAACYVAALALTAALAAALASPRPALSLLRQSGQGALFELAGWLRPP